MKDKKGIPEILLLLITEQALLFPVSLSALVLTKAPRIFVIYCLILIFTSLVLVIHVYTPRKWMFPVVTGNYLALAAGLAAFSGINTGSETAFVIGAAFLTRSLWLVRNRNKGFSFYSFVAIGILAYAAVTFLYSRSSLFSPFLGYVAVAATFAITGGCFCINMTHLGYERRIVNKISIVPKLTHSSNSILIIIFIILILVVASLGFIDQLFTLLGHFWNFLKGVGASISKWYESLFEYKEQAQDINVIPANPDDIPATQTSPLMKILYEAGYYLGLSIMSFGLAFILYMFFKKSKVVFIFIGKKLLQVYKRFMAGQGGIEVIKPDYEDEVTSLLKEGESTLDAARRWLSSGRGNERPYFALQTNSERARWLYKHTVKKALNKGFSIKSAMTSHEVLDKIQPAGENSTSEMLGKAANAYNMARYGSREPSDNDISILREFHSVKSPRV